MAAEDLTHMSADQEHLATTFHPLPPRMDVLDEWEQAQKEGIRERSRQQPRSPLKPTNPKEVVGIRKVSFAVLPWRVLTGVALAMLEGACKYGRHNYRHSGVRGSVYFDAVVGRHLTQWWEGEDIDEASGLHHIDKAIAGLMVLRDAIYQGVFEDDRPPRAKDFSIDALNSRAAEIIDMHSDKKPKHFTELNIKE